LAYRKASYVNWCPKDQTVLANEQVIAGLCERCGSVVTKRLLTQWYFKITEYAERLLDDMDDLVDGWPERVLTMQRNWIGRSEGAYVDFMIENRAEPVRVFTTRPDTLYGATFFVIAPDAPLAAEVVSAEQRAAFEDYFEQTKHETEIERQSTERPKTGVFLGVHATNPVNGEKIRSTPPTTCWPNTAQARSWLFRLMINAIWILLAPSDCRYARWLTPAVPIRSRVVSQRPVRVPTSIPVRWTS
jgi:leucyl-tRNA synthetase